MKEFTEKQIEDAINKAYEEAGDNAYFGNGFRRGIKFAQADSNIDEKIKQLKTITSNLPFVEYYSHTNCEMWKILNEYTTYRKDKFVLCKFDEGFEMALDLAIEHIGKKKLEFEI